MGNLFLAFIYFTLVFTNDKDVITFKLIQNLEHFILAVKRVLGTFYDGSMGMSIHELNL